MSKIKNLVKAYSNVTQQDLFKKESKAWSRSWYIIIPGQLIRFAEADGQLLFPQFLRHHLSNLADGFMAAGTFNLFQMQLTSIFGKEAKSRPMLSAAVAESLMFTWEMVSAIPEDRKFDSTDMSLHTASVAAYIAFSTKIKKENPIKPTGP